MKSEPRPRRLKPLLDALAHAGWGEVPIPRCEVLYFATGDLGWRLFAFLDAHEFAPGRIVGFGPGPWPGRREVFDSASQAAEWVASRADNAAGPV